MTLFESDMLSSLIETLLILFATSFVHFLQKRIFNKNFNSDRITLNDSANVVLIKSLHRPLLFLIWIVGVYIALLAMKPT